MYDAAIVLVYLCDSRTKKIFSVVTHNWKKMVVVAALIWCSNQVYENEMENNVDKLSGWKQFHQCHNLNDKYKINYKYLKMM